MKLTNQTVITNGDSKPNGDLVIQTLAMPMDTNVNGDIFGGWVLSQMDIGAGVVAKINSPTGRAVTVSVDSMSFINPIHVGELVSVYASVLDRGRTSIKIQVEVWVYNYFNKVFKQVTSGIFKYVAIDDNSKPIPLIKVD